MDCKKEGKHGLLHRQGDLRMLETARSPGHGPGPESSRPSFAGIARKKLAAPVIGKARYPSDRYGYDQPGW
jgi:hypothetical protein